MGYAIFASRKIALINELNSLQVKLDQIMNEKMNLLNFSANIADGTVSDEEFYGDYSNAHNYSVFQNERNEYIKKNNGYDNVNKMLWEYKVNNSDYHKHVFEEIGVDNFYAASVEDQSRLTNDALAKWAKEDSTSYNKWVKDYDAYQQKINNGIIGSLSKEYYQNVETKRIAAMENELEMKQKKIESQITAVQNDLQSCEQAEAKAMQLATPKYAGLG